MGNTKITALVLAGVAYSGLAAAQGIESSSGFGMELGGGYYYPDDRRGLDQGGIGALGLEYRFGKNWAINGWYLRSQELDMYGLDEDGVATGDGRVDNAHLDATYYFSNGRWQPYVSAGAGRSRFSYDIADDRDQNQYNLGFGLKFHMSPGWFLRGDVRGYRGLSDRTDGAAVISVGYQFGQKAKAPPVVDSDGDGVPDGSDQCPNTPSGVAVDSVGCPLDSDGDGVPDYMDECPDTPAGAVVNERGCVEEALLLMESVSMELDIKTGFDSAAIDAAGRAEVQGLAEFMTQYPTTEVVIEGHTDSSGAAAYNQELSERRAGAVASLLVSDFGIDPARVSTVGYGETQPVANNDNAAGREANRRIVATLEAEVEVEAEEVVE